MSKSPAALHSSVFYLAKTEEFTLALRLAHLCYDQSLIFNDVFGSSITDPTYWITASSSLCPSGTATICGISFSSTQYPLSGGKPSSTFLTNEVAVHYNDGASGVHSFTVNGVTYYRKP